MPEIPKNNAESDFHRRRKAFVIFDCGVLTARDNFDGSHFDLLRLFGFDEKQARGIIEQNARGYALDGNVYLYQGADFSCLSEQNKKTAALFLPWFEKNGWLAETGKVFDGMRAGRIGSRWVPIKEF